MGLDFAYVMGLGPARIMYSRSHFGWCIRRLPSSPWTLRPWPQQRWVVDDSREAAVRELLLERDRLADDLEMAHADLELARDAMRGVLHHLEAGRVLWAKVMLEEALDTYRYVAPSPDVEARDGNTAVALDRLPGEVGSED